MKTADNKRLYQLNKLLCLGIFKHLGDISHRI